MRRAARSGLLVIGGRRGACARRARALFFRPGSHRAASGRPRPCHQPALGAQRHHPHLRGHPQRTGPRPGTPQRVGHLRLPLRSRFTQRATAGSRVKDRRMAANAPRSAGKRQRADLALVEQGLAPSREKARALILAGEVLAGDRPIDKAGDLVDAGAELRLRSAPMPYVSRGGVKLAHALDTFGDRRQRAGRAGRRRVDGRLHRLPAAARGGARLLRRRRPRAAGVEGRVRSARARARRRQHPAGAARSAARARRPRRHRRVVHLAAPRVARAAAAGAAGRAGRRAGQAAVRGRPRRRRQGRHRARRGGARPRAGRGARRRRRARLRRRRRHRLADHRRQGQRRVPAVAAQRRRPRGARA